MSQALWAAAEAAEAMGGTLVGAGTERSWQASGISIDSRTTAPGDLFIALEGPNSDGHDYVKAALARGAVSAVVHRMATCVSDDAPLLVVDDTMRALWALGAAARARGSARITCITGSVGKTGTKTALAAALALAGPTHATIGNLNNQWGAPLSLARMPRATAYGVIELGMNHAGEISPLAQLAQPEVAVITAIAPAHLEFFDSVAAIADAKAEIFDGLVAGGCAVLPRDSEFFDRLATVAGARGAGRVIGFGAAETAEARLLSCTATDGGSRVRAEVLGAAVDFTLLLPGRHNALNALAALAAAHALGVKLSLAASALESLRPQKGRGQMHSVRLPGGTFEVIDDTYNASPASMRAALSVLAERKPRGRRIAALGDMLELGREADAMHAGLAPAIEAAGVAQVFCAGPHMAALYRALPAALHGANAPSAKELMPKLLGAVRPGDSVLVKGSHGSAMAPIVEALLALGQRAGGDGARRMATVA
ncbi:MAG: UDP-N-acetylmuramoyl-tripeptide--D-alanyl-D-alanine ligase [Alphaproteobacteria bacterium]|nr:UDP-N-acetylmuramoyl-tripeptide--D-alanyl-D-alanine ligase [Alphaproteobacteria bacterium]